MTILLHLPPLVSMLILSAIIIIISNILLRKIRKRFHHDVLKENHEVAGFIYNAFGLIYGVLVAFVVYVSWTDYSDSKKNVEREANLIVSVFSYSRGLPDSLRINVRSIISEYARLIAEDEWKMMEEGKFSEQAREQFIKLWSLYFTVDPKTLPNPVVYEESLSCLKELGDCRRTRLFQSRDVIPPILWFVILVCAACSVGYTFFFGVRNIRVQSIMTSVLAVINTFLLYIIFVFDHPFRGYGKISNVVYNAVLQLTQQMK